MTIKEKIAFLEALASVIEDIDRSITWRKEYIVSDCPKPMVSDYELDIKGYERLKAELEKMASDC